MMLCPEKNEMKWLQAVKPIKWISLTNTWPEGTSFRFWNPTYDAERRHQISWFGGIDVHQKILTVGIYGIDPIQSPERVLGPIYNFSVSDLGYKELFQFFDYFNLKRILMETTGVYSFEPYIRLKDQYPALNGEVRVICMNAHDLKQLLVPNKKTDKVDTSRLAFLASVPELLRESYIPTREEYILRMMLRHRNKYQSEATKYKNRIKTLFAAGGFRWQFSYKNEGHQLLLTKFIDQFQPFGAFLENLKQDPELPGEINKILLKDQEHLMLRASYKQSALERLNAHILFGMNKKSEGMVEIFDKTIYEQLMMLPRFQDSIKLIQDLPGLGEWSLATIILETGPIERFPMAGAYVSYAGLTSGVAESADVKVKKGNNPHSHRILKQAYRTLAMRLLGMIIRAANHNSDSQFQQCHPLVEYARKINGQPITNGKKANKIAAKAARMVYGMLMAKTPYDPCHDIKQSQEVSEWNQKHRLVIRYSALQRQIALLKSTYEDLIQTHGLTQEPFVEKTLLDCQDLCTNLDRTPLLQHLRNASKEIRSLKESTTQKPLRKKQTTKKDALRRNRSESLQDDEFQKEEVEL